MCFWFIYVVPWLLYHSQRLLYRKPPCVRTFSSLGATTTHFRQLSVDSFMDLSKNMYAFTGVEKPAELWQLFAPPPFFTCVRNPLTLGTSGGQLSGVSIEGAQEGHQNCAFGWANGALLGGKRNRKRCKHRRGPGRALGPQRRCLQRFLLRFPPRRAPFGKPKAQFW